MIVSQSKKFVFIHTPKTGGTSIKAVLSRFVSSETTDMFHWHCSALDAKRVLQHWSEYYSFAFVRNPYDIQVSMYNYILRLGVMHPEYNLVKRYRNASAYVKGHFRTL